jgi:hypothetical protein
MSASSDPTAEKSVNNTELSVAELWSEGQEPKGMWTSKPRAGHRTGKACHKRWNAYGKHQGLGRRRPAKIVRSLSRLA